MLYCSHVGIEPNVSLRLLMDSNPLLNKCSRNIDNQIRAGIEVTLSCVPMPSQFDIVTWFRNGVNINKDPSFNLMVSETSGEYKCIVKGPCSNFSDFVNLPKGKSCCDDNFLHFF